MRAWLGGLALLFIVILPGCFSQHVTIHIKPDGSGTLELTKLASGPVKMYMKNLRDGLAALKQAGQPLPPNSEIPQGIKDLFSEEEGKKLTYSLGQDVTFVGFEQIATEEYDGSINTYAFKDITKVKIMEAPNLSQINSGMNYGPIQWVTFKFEKGENKSLLTAVFPTTGYKKTGDKDKDAEAEAREKELAIKQAEAEKRMVTAPGQPLTMPATVPPEMIMMVKPYLQGTKLSMAVVVEGTLISTNSPFVDEKKNRVILFDLNFQELAKEDEALKKLLFRDKSVESAKKVMKDLPGCKVNPESEMKIEFKEGPAVIAKP